jgi:PAS domain S-box-containing protein
MKDTPFKEKILIIDENPSSIDLIKTIIETEGYELLVATTGQNALKILKKTKPDLIFLDIIMQGMDGYELCRRLKADKENKEIPVVFMTSLTSTSDKLKGFDAGGVDYVTKPVEAEELLARIRIHLSIRKMHAQLKAQNKRLRQQVIERKRAEKALRESEEKYRRIFQNIQDVYYETQLDGKILEISPSIEDISQYKREDILGKSILDVYVNSEKRERFITELQKRDRVSDYEILLKDRNGLPAYCSNNAKLVRDEQGNPVKIIGAVRNIQKRKQIEKALRDSEVKFRTLVEQIQAITYTAALDDKSTTLYISPQIESLLGFSRREWKKDPDIWSKQIHSEDRDRVLNELKLCHERNEPFISEYRLLSRQGKIVWCRDEAVIVMDENDSPSYLQGVMFDITDQKQTEKQIHMLSHELMKAHESERQKISRELHDRIGQDLSSIKIGFDILYDSQIEMPKDIRQNISEFSKTLDRIIKSVRDLSYDLRPPALDQFGLVQVVDLYCEDFSKKTGLNIDFTTAGLNGLTLNYDIKINLYRIVQEGLNNIWKHANAESVTLRLLASFPNIILRIVDDGQGFDVKSRRESALNERRMGLRGMEERVNLLQGKMKCQSHPGKGTDLCIEVPYAEEDNGAKEKHTDHR